MLSSLGCFIFCPAVVAALLGLRARLTGKSDAWADYSDVTTVLQWFVGPVIVALTPFLLTQRGCTEIKAVCVSTLAIVLFYAASYAFTPETGGRIIPRLRMLAWRSGAGIGYAGYLLYVGSSGRAAMLFPSAYLYIMMIWASLIGGWVGQFFGRNLYRGKTLGPGELMDRIREITQRSGVKLEQVILIRRLPGSPPVVNAAAVEGTQVILFDDLINGLNDSEVDAVIEHEVGHIADERLWTLDKALRYAAWVVLLGAAALMDRYVRTAHAPWHRLVYFVWPVLFILPEAASRWYSRVAERRANRNVGRLTDPLAAITGIYKISVLNHHPISRPWWSRIISTHPCADEEINDVARREELTRELVAEAFMRADQEIGGVGGKHYALSSRNVAQVDVQTGNLEPVLVPRSGGSVGFKVAVFLVLGGVVFFAACMCVAAAMGNRDLCWIPILTGFVGGLFVILLPMAAVKRGRMGRLRKQIADKLAYKYGAEISNQSLLADVLLPDWADQDQPWQGALLRVAEGELAILGEADSLRVPLSDEISVSRWTAETSIGSDARMVVISFRVGDQVCNVLLRLFACPEQGQPRNWKQLEKYIKNKLTNAGARTVSPNDLGTRHSLTLKWSARVPIAAALYVAILALADYVCRLLNGPDIGTRVMWFLLATSVAGSGLYVWVAGFHKPSVDEPEQLSERVDSEDHEH